jgi:hypothetical protein
MKKLIIPILSITLFSCKPEWNKETVKTECVEIAKKSMPKASSENLKMMEELCYCSAEKTVAKYKTQAEAEKDKKGLESLTMDCMKEYYANTLQHQSK